MTLQLTGECFLETDGGAALRVSKWSEQQRRGESAFNQDRALTTAGEERDSLESADEEHIAQGERTASVSDEAVTAAYGAPRAAVTLAASVTRVRLHCADLLIVDDRTLYRETLIAAVAARGGMSARAAWNLSSLTAAFAVRTPDVVLMDIATSGGTELLTAIFRSHPHTRVVALGLSDQDESSIIACARAGVAGYHLRTETLDDLFLLIDTVADGQSSCPPAVSAILLRHIAASVPGHKTSAAVENVLTTREIKILEMIELGLSNQEIATRLYIAVSTVKNHVHSILTKLAVTTRTAAVARLRAGSPAPYP